MRTAVQHIKLNGAAWRSADDFYNAFFVAVGAPTWHGRNLDALEDSIGSGSINAVEVPYAITIVGTESMSPEAREFLSRLDALIADLRAMGVPVELQFDR